MLKVVTPPPHEREQIISQAVKAAANTYPFYDYQSEKKDLPLVRIDISTPIYRMANYRTCTVQLQYIYENAVKDNFFSSGQENDSAQQAQHEILFSMSKKGISSSVNPIYEELKTEFQREPLLITATGVVVNGNRRLAAMRELFSSDPKLYKKFGHVDCAVLPSSVTATEITEIEISLQMQPETKLPYGWIEEAIAIRDEFNSGKSGEYIAELTKQKKKDIENKASALNELDIYLKEWLKKPFQYHLISGGEQLFKDLAKALNGKSAKDMEIKRRFAWILFSNDPDERKYAFNFSFNKKSDELANLIADRLSIELAVEKEKTDIDDLFIDLDEDQTEFSYQPLINYIDNEENKSELADEFMSACETLMETEKQVTIGQRALEDAKFANNRIQGIDLSTADNSTYTKIEKQLDSIIEKAYKLKAKLQDYKSSDN